MEYCVYSNTISKGSSLAKLWLAVYEVIGIIKTLQRLQTEYWLQLKRVKSLFEWILGTERIIIYAFVPMEEMIMQYEASRSVRRSNNENWRGSSSDCIYEKYACSIMDSSLCFIYYTCILYVGLVLPKIIGRKVVDILFGTLIHPQITPQLSHCQNFWSVTYELVWAPLM